MELKPPLTDQLKAKAEWRTIIKRCLADYLPVNTTLERHLSITLVVMECLSYYPPSAKAYLDNNQLY